MASRSRIPIPILVDDVSPRAFSDDFHPRISVDLAGSDILRESEDILRSHVSVPDLAVLEELESIRGMIENKSRDLHRKELTLSKSINKWNSEIIEAQRLIEELAENLSATGETKLQDAFSKCEKKLTKMCQKLDGEIKKHEARRSICLKGSADVPPLPGEANSLNLNERILDIISFSPTSVSRLVACSTLILLQEPTPSNSQIRFCVNNLFHAITSFIAGRFDRLLRLSIESEPQFHSEDVSSKFSAVKQTILKKRLGLPTTEISQKLSIVVREDYSGIESTIDVQAELDDDLRLILMRSIPEETPSSSPMVRLFTDPCVQCAVGKNLRTKSSRGTIETKILELMLSPVSDRALVEKLHGIRKDITVNQNSNPLSVTRYVMCFLFLAHRVIEDARPNEVAVALCDILDAVSGSVAWNGQISRMLSEWPQGLWFIVRTVIGWKGTSEYARIVDSLFSFLKLADCSNALIPWKDVIIEKLNSNQINPSVIGHAKGILKRLTP
jgi:hypothetical protein